MALADHVVVNDDLEDTIDEMLAIIDAARDRPDRPHGTGSLHRLADGSARPAPRPIGDEMEREHDTMMTPPIEELLDRVDSKFGLVTLAARRARNINAYFNQLGEGLGHMVPPQVAAAARKPLSIGFEEIAADKIRWADLPEEVPARRGRRGDGAARTAPRPPRPSPDRRRPMLAGKRIVLGVTGGIAAYKAVEVCRRLVDAGAHVVPVMTKGAEHFVGRTTFTGAGQRAGPDGAVRRRRPDPAHPPRPDGRPRARRPGHGPRDRRLRRRAVDRPADERAAGDARAGADLPGDAHRDVGAPGGRREHADAAPARRARRRAGRRAPRRR